jgi:hypothetical protein
VGDLKKFKVALIVGGILVIISLYFLFAGFMGRSGDSFTIPEGEEWYYAMELNMDSGGYISVQYTESQGNPVDAYIFDSSAYSVYSFQGSASAITKRIGQSSGTISTTVPSAGSYYVVFDHGSGYENSAQSVSVILREAGLSYIPIIIGVCLLVAGIVVIIIGLRIQRSEDSAVVAKPPPDDVMIFDRRR